MSAIETNFTVDLKAEIITRYLEFLESQPTGYLVVSVQQLFSNNTYGFVQQLDISNQSFGTLINPNSNFATLIISTAGGLLFSIPFNNNVARINLINIFDGKTLAVFDLPEPIEFPEGGSFIVDSIELTLKDE